MGEVGQVGGGRSGVVVRWRRGRRVIRAGSDRYCVAAQYCAVLYTVYCIVQ